MADQFPIFGGGRCRKTGDPGIDPSDRIDGIGTVRWDVVRDKKTFVDRLFHPSFISPLLFNRPTTIPHLPELIRGFILSLAKGDLKGTE